MTKLRQLILTATAAVLAIAGSHTAIAADQKSILVTGASTGIGRHLTETLAETTSTPAPVRTRISRR